MIIFLTVNDNYLEFRFPDNVEKRRLWASLTGLPMICPKKEIFICSDHFNPKDIKMGLDGKNYLERDANLLSQHSIFENIDTR